MAKERAFRGRTDSPKAATTAADGRPEDGHSARTPEADIAISAQVSMQQFRCWGMNKPATGVFATAGAASAYTSAAAWEQSTVYKQIV
jgi:hypothetical protein